MENPTFKLEGIIRTKEEMADFEGPLNLILQLLSKNKVEIKDIPIAVILDQYLAYLEEMEQMDLEIASEFVSMASHLVYIKTKTLLAGDKEVTELELLIQSLEELKNKDKLQKIQEVLALLQRMWERGKGYLCKLPEPRREKKVYSYVHQPADLIRALIGVFDKAEVGLPPTPNPFIPTKAIAYPVTEKAEEIIARLQRTGSASLREIFRDSRNRSELVATFISILEMCKTGEICLIWETDDFVVCIAQDLLPIAGEVK